MTTKQMIEVLQAYERGEKCEYRIKRTADLQADEPWFDVTTGPSYWSFSYYEYRVKPELLEGWVNVYSSTTSCVFHTYHDARESSGINVIRTVRVREVE